MSHRLYPLQSATASAFDRDLRDKFSSGDVYDKCKSLFRSRKENIKLLSDGNKYADKKQEERRLQRKKHTLSQRLKAARTYSKTFRRDPTGFLDVEVFSDYESECEYLAERTEDGKIILEAITKEEYGNGGAGKRKNEVWKVVRPEYRSTKVSAL